MSQQAKDTKRNTHVMIQYPLGRSLTHHFLGLKSDMLSPSSPIQILTLLAEPSSNWPQSLRIPSDCYFSTGRQPGASETEYFMKAYQSHQTNPSSTPYSRSTSSSSSITKPPTSQQATEKVLQFKPGLTHHYKQKYWAKKKSFS